MIGALTWASAGIAAYACGLTAFNLVTWPRGGGRPSPEHRVSVLIPARNEAQRVEACVRAALASRYPLHEVVVCDDGSTDATGDILSRLAATNPKLRVIQGRALPTGWVGKVHACHQLAAAATGDVLLFIDADVRLSPDGVRRMLAPMQTHGADCVTAVPGQDMPSLAEGLLMPLLHFTYTAWLPLPLVWFSQNPSLLAANGQLLAVRRPALDAAGGFAAIRGEIVDDMALTRRIKESGSRVLFADGQHIARCRMYHSADQIWAGFSKNLYLGLGASPVRLMAVVSLHLLAFFWPWLALAISPLWPALALPAIIAITAALLARLLLAWRLSHPWWSAFLHPIAVLGLVGIGLNSWRWHRSGRITWAGRHYAPTRAA